MFQSAISRLDVSSGVCIHCHPTRSRVFSFCRSFLDSCPITVLGNWSNRWSQDLVEAEKKRITSQNTAGCGSLSSPIAPKSAHFSATATLKRIALIEHTSPGHGLPNVIQYRLTAPVRQKSDAMNTVKGWVQKAVGMNNGSAKHVRW